MREWVHSLNYSIMFYKNGKFSKNAKLVAAGYLLKSAGVESAKC